MDVGGWLHLLAALPLEKNFPLRPLGVISYHIVSYHIISYILKQHHKHTVLTPFRATVGKAVIAALPLSCDWGVHAT